jgi:hypothetical protein
LDRAAIAKRIGVLITSSRPKRNSEHFLENP